MTMCLPKVFQLTHSIVAQPSANPTGLFSVRPKSKAGEATHDLQTSNNALEMT